MSAAIVATPIEGAFPFLLTIDHGNSEGIRQAVSVIRRA
jgi:hypothetical protein